MNQIYRFWRIFYARCVFIGLWCIEEYIIGLAIEANERYAFTLDLNLPPL